MEEIKTKESIQKMMSELKNLKENSSSEKLAHAYDACIILANKYKQTGQFDALKKVLYKMKVIMKEQQLVDLGITTYINSDVIEDYIKESQSNKIITPAKIIELSRFEREIPDELVEIIQKTKDIFNEYYVVFTDYTGEIEKKIEAEKKEKDPILFGAFKPSRGETTANIKIYERMYYLGDWIDEYCDLTLEKLVNDLNNIHYSNLVIQETKPILNIDELREVVKEHEGKLKQSTGNKSFMVRTFDKLRLWFK